MSVLTDALIPGQQKFNGNSPVDREVPVHLGLLAILGSHRFLGDLNIISLTKGRVSRFLGSAKSFLTEDYYSPL